jgi:ABC-type uncharacterized transport system auxiliary subunit
MKLNFDDIQKGVHLKTKLLSSFIFLIAFAFLVNCGGVPPIYYYRINYQMPESQANSSPLPVTLGIRQFESDILYEEDRIVYRNSPYEVQYYHYRRWIAPPRKMAKEMLLDQFSSSGIFKQVISLPSASKPDYILHGKIKAFEEWDEDGSWYGLVTLSFELLKSETKEIVWKNTFSEKTPASKKEPVEVVKAISISMQQVVQKAITEIERKLKTS